MLHPSSKPSPAPKNRTVVRSKNALRLTKAALQTAFIVSEDLGAGFAERLFTTPRRHPRPPRETAILASARESIVDITLRSPRTNGTQLPIATWRWGHGPAVLLVHGWEGRGSQLGAFVEPLVNAGLSVVAFDAPGHGSSPSNRLYLTDLADAVTDVAASIGAPLHGVVAHSFGAAGVLLAGTRNGFRAPRNVMVAPNVIIDDAVRRFARLVGLDDTDRIALEARLAAHTGVPVDTLRLDRLVANRDESLLVIHDRDDKEVSFEHGERLAALWSGPSRLIDTTGLGHRRILRDEAVLAATVALLREGVEPPVSDLVREVDRQLEDA
ncbi:MAG TPA: alpha/beta fold hydrolase [Kofleriaceae bacterium]|nr:alpha/beta fold hydrolase [Kofleriaceae bacterium]